MKIYLSQSNNPYFNLALENWIFLEALESDKILFLWQNNPCVVIGRAQNPWQECYLKAMLEDNIPIIRRQSGGGTVFHDMGNLNYTILSPKKDHNVKENLELICNVIKKIGIDIYPNCRNDIVTDFQDFTYKVSGSAFREKRDRAFHHGTLLIKTNTNKLYKYLHQPIDKTLDAKGVKSHRSKVLNLNTIKEDLSPNDVIRAFLTYFKSSSISFIGERTPLNNRDLIINEAKNLRSWDWTYGKTLPFTKTYSENDHNITIEVKSGLIDQIGSLDISSKKIPFSQELTFPDINKYLTKI
ncbi:lipoate--protein ligase [Pseudofrancisella aestuarii]|uniref:Lipoate--protein ligase n=1 Tax=Pseudofrancisella aestuarii TaxID=2670347 RepID=A0ABV9TDP4_9GAMM|nr:lipoate--protein ligase [Pseudofrancisella aestuarii]